MAESAAAGLHSLDWLIVGVYLAITLAVGVKMRRVAPADALRTLWPLYLELGPFIRRHDGGRAKGLAPGRSGRVEVACRVRSLDFATGALLGWLRERGFEDVRVWKEEPGGARLPLYPLAFSR